MKDIVTKLLIVLSIITGLLFGGILCYVTSVSLPDRSLQPTPETIGAAKATPTVKNTPTTSKDAWPTPTDSSSASPPLPTSAPVNNGTDNNLTWDGLQVDIANINYDAWPLIKAQNRNNDPPLEGMTMLMITARVTNVDGNVDEPVTLDASDFQLIGDRGTPYQTFRVSCGVVPDKLDGAIALGKSMDGNICFQISKDENDFELIYEPYGSPAIYFDLPQRNDTDWQPLAPPPVLIEADGLTRNGLKIDIADINYEAWPLIKAENSNNDQPLEGRTMLLITVRVANVEGNPEEIVDLTNSDFKLIGDRKTVYETFRVSCGVVPNNINTVVALGATTEANICFQVSTTEGNFELIYEPHNVPASYHPLPSRDDVE